MNTLTGKFVIYNDLLSITKQKNCSKLETTERCNGKTIHLSIPKIDSSSSFGFCQRLYLGERKFQINKEKESIIDFACYANIDFFLSKTNEYIKNSSKLIVNLHKYVISSENFILDNFDCLKLNNEFLAYSSLIIEENAGDNSHTFYDYRLSQMLKALQFSSRQNSVLILK